MCSEEHLFSTEYGHVPVGLPLYEVHCICPGHNTPTFI